MGGAGRGPRPATSLEGQKLIPRGPPCFWTPPAELPSAHATPSCPHDLRAPRALTPCLQGEQTTRRGPATRPGPPTAVICTVALTGRRWGSYWNQGVGARLCILQHGVPPAAEASVTVPSLSGIACAGHCCSVFGPCDVDSGLQPRSTPSSFLCRALHIPPVEGPDASCWGPSPRGPLTGRVRMLRDICLQECSL